jgi:hypothetical protein
MDPIRALEYGGRMGKLAGWASQISAGIDLARLSNRLFGGRECDQGNADDDERWYVSH